MFLLFRLQPLGLVADPMMVSNACLGIVSSEEFITVKKLSTLWHNIIICVLVTTQLSYQRPRSCTTPGLDIGNPRPAGHGGSRSGKSARKRSYSAVLPRNLPIDQLKELTSTMSVTQQTGFMPEEKTNTDSEITNPITTSDNDRRNQMTKTSQTDISHHKDKAQNFSYPSMTGNKLEIGQTSNDKLQILPPVVRHGELAMKVEVRRLKVSRDSITLDSNQVVTTTSEQTEQSTATNCIVDNGLPQLSTNGLNVSKPPAKTSESETNEENSGEKIATRDISSPRSTPSSPTKVSIVSVGEASTVRPKSHLHRRRRRHSNGRLLGSGHLSQGWSPPQAIEPLVGSPLHTPRKQPQVKGRRELVNEEQQSKELEATRSLMTSPGLMINVDVNEFLQDTDADDPA